MISKLNRRSFLLGVLAAPSLSSQAAAKTDADVRPTRPLLDIHAHLFGDGKSGSGCRMSKRITGGLQFQGLVWALGLRHKGKNLDDGYERVLAEQVKGSGLSMAAILG